MKRLYIIFIFLVLSVTLVAQANYKKKSRYGFDVNSRPTIYYNTFASHINGTKLHFCLNIQNDILQFRKNGDNYSARYEISILLRNAKEKQTVFSDSWYKNVTLNNFEDTNLKNTYQQTRKIFDVKFNPGIYELNIEVRDANTGNVFHSKRQINIGQKSKESITHSRPVFIDSKIIKADDILISGFGKIVEFNNSPIIYFEIETPKSDSLTITSKLIRIKKEKKSSSVENKYHLYSDKNYFQFTEALDRSFLTEGEYRLEYAVNYLNKKITIKDTFEVVWFDKPKYLYEYELAIRPMKYLLSESQYDSIEDLSRDELDEWFTTYWDKKDPSPDTPLNELQYEFYSRVQKAIMDYSSRFKEGWRTSRGEAFIVYGEPSKVEKHHHVIDKNPFEIWYYNDLNKKLIFIDTNNSGDFKLANIEKIEENN